MASASPDKPSSTRPDHLSDASRYWNQVLDPQNLERAATAPGGRTLPLEEEIAFAQTPDFTCALAWLQRAPAGRTGGGSARILDLGAGLGTNAFALARHGERVWAVDTSLNRLRLLRERARQAGCAEAIGLIVADAEAMPLAAGSIDKLYTRSVLIHTRLPVTAAEIARILAPGGRAALVEPQPGNPFAWLYRRTLAPRAWRAITRYFDPAAQAMYRTAVAGDARAGRVIPFYLLSFLAFGFQYAWPRRGWFTRTLAVLSVADRGLFRLCPRLRRAAWFGVLCLEKPASRHPTERQWEASDGGSHDGPDHP